MSSNPSTSLMTFDFVPPYKDLSGHHISLNLASGAKSHEDSVMGACVSFSRTASGYTTPEPVLFNGSAAIFQNGITISVWAKFDTLEEENCLLHFGDGNNHNSVRFYTSGTQLCYANGSANFKHSEILLTDRWYYLAVTVDNEGNAVLYVHGSTNTQNQTKNAALAPPTNLDRGSGFELIGIDFTKPASTSAFSGLMAWMAIYPCALDEEGITADMNQRIGGNQASTFRQSYAIDFKLYSDDNGAENPIMFIKDAGEGEDLNLRITNKSGNDLTLKPGTAPASLNNYHFQLRFRPGTLTEDFVGKTAHSVTLGSMASSGSWAADEWSATVTSEPKSGVDVICLLYIGSKANPASTSLAQGDQGKIVIKAVNASATQGSRNTNVELKYQKLYSGTDTTIDGYRTQNVSIVNHSGEKEIPLRAEIVGNASIMTYAKQADGTGDTTPPTSELMFRIVNTGSKSLPLALPGAKDGATEFTLTIDVQPEGDLVEWALIAQGDINEDLKTVVGKLGVIRFYDGDKTITMIDPLSKSIDPNAALVIDDSSDSAVTIDATASTNGATAGTYQIVLSAKPTNADKIKAGDTIKLQSSTSKWTASPFVPPPPPGKPAPPPPSHITSKQWTITNKTVTELKKGEGFTFLLEGIQCSLPSGSSTIRLSYKNIPGHWQGAFEIPVTRSPLAINQNLIGINTNEPEASLHMVEEKGFTPFRISKPTASGPLSVDLDSGTGTLTTGLDLKPISASSDAVIGFVSTKMVSRNGGFSVEVYTFKSGSFTKNQYPLSAPGSALAGAAIYHQGALFALSYDFNNVSDFYLRTYVFNGTAAPSTPNHYPLQYQGNDCTTTRPPAIVNDFLFLPATIGTNGGMMVYSGVNSGSSTTAPTLTFEKWVSMNPPAFLHADGDFLYMISGDMTNMLIWHIGADASHTETSFPFTGDWTNAWNIKSVSDDAVFIGMNNPVTAYGIVDVSDPTKPYILQSPDTPVHGMDIKNFVTYQGLIISCVDERINVVDFSKKGTYKILKSIPMEASCDLYRVEDKLIVSEVTATAGQRKVLVYDLPDFIEHYFGQNTILSSDNITIGATDQASISFLEVPCPQDTTHNGIVIGDELTSEPAALSISLPSGSTANPLAVIDHQGNPIFNIKQASSTDGPYRVGIGTDNPKAPLHVASYQNFPQLTYYAYLNSVNGRGLVTSAGKPPSYSINTGIYCENSVQASEFDAVQFSKNSDARIKDFVQHSPPPQDLATLLKLRVSDYQYIDIVKQGATQKKGLIAQQVKEVFPQAVNGEKTQFIPNIYAMATDLSWQPITRNLRVSLEKGHDLKTGDKVRLLADQGFEEKEVVAVPDDKSFVVAEWEKPVEKLFVFGKEVHDFHTVDYDQVAMLGVSAIQALHAEVECLKKEKEALKAQMQTEMSALREEWMAFKSSLTQQHQNQA